MVLGKSCGWIRCGGLKLIVSCRESLGNKGWGWEGKCIQTRKFGK